MNHRNSGVLLAALACLMAAGVSSCGYNRLPEERTEEGLVRVPSRSYGGVYRKPNASYLQYKRVMLEPPTVDFVDEWRKKHPDVTDREVARLRKEAVDSFREEFLRAFVKKGQYPEAQTREADVLIVVPRVIDLDVPAPALTVDPGTRTFSPQPVKMQINGEVRDAVTGELLMRIIVIEAQDRFPGNEVRLVNRVTNAHQMGLSFAKWVRLAREAVDVAKASRPHSDFPRKASN